MSLSPSTEQREQEFARELAALLNRYSAENESNTPDFLLADFLRGALRALDKAVREREQWYGVEHRPGAALPREVPPREPVGYASSASLPWLKEPHGGIALVARQDEYFDTPLYTAAVPPRDPTPEMLDRMADASVVMGAALCSSDLRTLWRTGYDAWLAEASLPRPTDEI